MKQTLILTPFFLITFLISLGCTSKVEETKTPALFETRKEAEKAVETLIRWAGDDPDREGLRETPKRVINAYEEFFSGYKESADKFLSKTFEDVQGYQDMVMLKDIPFNSHCEHHMVPIIGVAHIAYIPVKKVVGISKLARNISKKYNFNLEIRNMDLSEKYAKKLKTFIN